LFIVGLISVVVAAGGGFAFGVILGNRVDDLTETAARWSVGELSAPARERTPLLAKWIPSEYLRDEVNQLAGQLDDMRESFRQAIERMKKR
jgi:HAMP domain-containing protein